MKLIIKIALGILLAAAILFVVNLTLASIAIKSLNQKILEENNKAHAAQIKIAEHKKLVALNKIRQAKEKEINLRKAKKMKQLKDQAWFEWYKEPDGCNSWRSNSHMVECTNHKMRSKSEFNVLWRNGDILNPI